jgi:hypothetical protein
MKSLTLRSSVALACALSLAGCGGGGGNLLLSGSISGLTKSGLELQNNGGAALAVTAGSTYFSFPDLIANNQDFNVTVKTQPAGAVCAVAYGKGNSGSFNVTSVQVSCITNTYELGGTVSGLDVNGLVLVNGSDRKEIKAGDTSFTMTRAQGDGLYPYGKVADGSPYGLTVLTQPAGRTCTVVNGVGTMGSAPVTTVQVKCA